ncbi:CCA tRNA nucleotidyltransferase [Sphingomonas quercus]|uniref:CCA tRNA nucleotidyltransferase n=1 Tax=Sphingomonas quercus TaxID=2842451 RepID=A0ABS6BH30_9SPHN|nr:CCA tRNA nucleotidyltransferase [Sphingomonas quercus]MBU3077111.1 CCA tRNA nucleotidyltransferase [Sphingomonas quercus]
MAEWRERDGLDRLLDALDAGRDVTRFVGGVVRDTLLGLPVTDIDLATQLPPAEVERRIAAAGLKPVPTGIAHGTVTAVLPGGPVEVTTLRRDLTTDGRRATIAFTDDWREDAARRDFTINALSAGAGFARGADVSVHDHFGGLGDLAARRVRFIGDPLARIAEDHLRILRFFRFHARFGGEPDAAALEACTLRANDLMALSRERIADETLKLLGLPDPTPTVALMQGRGIWAPVLPEIGPEGVARLTRLAARERALGVAAAALRRLAALLPPDPAVAAEVAGRLRLSRAQRDRLVTAATVAEPMTPDALAYRRGLEGAIDRLLLDEGGAADLARLAGWQRPRLPVSGGDLIALGLRAGPVVATALQAVERRWIAEGFPDAARVRVLAAEEAGRLLSDAS